MQASTVLLNSAEMYAFSNIAETTFFFFFCYPQW